jgi:hypothetical protein
VTNSGVEKLMRRVITAVAVITMSSERTRFSGIRIVSRENVALWGYLMEKSLL